MSSIRVARVLDRIPQGRALRRVLGAAPEPHPPEPQRRAPRQVQLGERARLLPALGRDQQARVLLDGDRSSSAT